MCAIIGFCVVDNFTADDPGFARRVRDAVAALAGAGQLRARSPRVCAGKCCATWPT